MMLRTLLLIVCLGVAPVIAEDRVLLKFDDAEASKTWQTVNDGVMGGRSDGRFKINDDKNMEFFGTLSLENNGGFASVRSREAKLGLKEGDSIAVRVRGDGREYTFRLNVPRSISRNSYRQSFKTKKDEWIEVTLPLEKFVATWRGRVFPNEKFDPGNITGMGIQLSDKQAGPFRLEVEWIKARSGPKVTAPMLVRRDIAYVEKGHERHKLDVHAPTEGEDHPIVFWIHGGGWRKGDKAGVQSKPDAFVKNGFVFISVNYRFVPDVTVKQMTSDIAKAIKWGHDHAEDYGGDRQSLFVAGHSAGAHLAALVCTDDRYLKAEGLSLSNITGCISVDTAAYDVASQVKNAGPLRGALYTAVFGKSEASQNELSPITYVAEGKGIPAFLILHVASRADSTARSQAFADVLKKAGVDASSFAAKGKNHGTINRELGLPGDPPTKALFEFVNGAL
ncbi:CIA30 family protein [Stieleria sp. ICT_E10.1]|uniref:CIA30 family protein n=1 Tax=Stieleria sedimenti TaxID=2976331 RepID=UPI0021809BC1|nr:CIA30 family protein [Stieleria sedimenti]MCS7469126.1 CIA30 family protein [Stieleria sedimenti]